MSKCIDLTGQSFGRLTVIEREKSTKDGKAVWKCICECGNTIVARGKDLRSGNTRSCGCINKEITSQRSRTHGMSHTRLHNIWGHIKDRCYNPQCSQYKDWGGRGITMCDEWLNDFQAFYDWAMSHGYRDDLTIDRQNNEGNYEPSNCRWVDTKAQNQNKRNNLLITYNGKCQVLKQWAYDLGMPYTTLYSRIVRYHWNIEKAFNTP